ncbi:MAG: hypothetical protein HQ508_03920 [Candidatus Marinimicrobia bacterium]|nr:hypothetical protein [Candidatus Neomarinimicrobiota bacterium]
MRNNLLGILLLGAVSLYAVNPALPKMYRYIEIQEVFQQWRHEEPGQFIFGGGDFNGDSLFDGVQLAVNVVTNEVVLLVFLANPDGRSFKWIELTSLPIGSLRTTGIQVIKPMEVNYYSDMTQRVKSHIYLKTDSINLFQSEGPASVYFWDFGKQSFQKLLATK